MNSAQLRTAPEVLSGYQQLDLEFDPDQSVLWSWMNAHPRPCFNQQLLREISNAERQLEAQHGHTNHQGAERRVEYVVFGSRASGVFNLGGDLDMFIQAIMRQDRDTLRGYAHLCIDNVYRRYQGFRAGVTTIALVQGKALGGGFEAALASDIIIAERKATFSLPEILFNLFPGMGAISFLSRRLGAKRTDELVTSGSVFSAKEMLDIGVVDEVVQDGLGVQAVKSYISHRERRGKSFRALQTAKRLCQPVTLDELLGITDVWVDTALKLETRDLRMMARLVRAQDRLSMIAQDDEEAVDKLYGSEPVIPLRR